MKFRGLVGTLVAFALLAPASASAEDKKFDVVDEFQLKDWVPIHLGPLDLSITRAVVYLLLGSLISIILGVGLMRWRLSIIAGTRQTLGELIYDIAETQVAETGLPTKAMPMWFPYVATIMIFIFVINLISFIPLPLTGQTYHGFPVWGIYAATSTISVTLALAGMTWVFQHIEGIRYNGLWRYLRSWVPDVPKGLLPLIIPIEVISQFMRLISLSVRLYANMLAGHILILTMIGLVFIIHTPPWRFLGLPAAFVFYVFEVVIVVTIQAFIFAALSAIYIGTAIEPEH
ncbi:MAG TPA: F0F1 ATP synthase subunit A [Gaiellaceae bacterium]|jgi:F-type H+-transporting ATPase subunit a|nr:F0F1 ATP synthase subunit A [Gaiellaceae bacterium]